MCCPVNWTIFRRVEKLRENIRKALRRRKLSVEELADEIGLGRSTMFQLMQDGIEAAPRLDTLKKLHGGGVTIPRDLFT